MFNAALDSPGSWFDCLNVGDDYEAKDDRRKDENLVIPGFSVVEIVGIRKINDDHFVHEVRLNRPRTATSVEADANTVGSGSNQAFTGPGDIPKNHSGRIKFAPAMCRFTGNEADTEKIHGRYKAPERTNGGKYTSAEYDAFEEQERLFGQGKRVQLIGTPDGSLKLPSGEDNSDQQFITGWDVMGVYKYRTGEKTKGKKDDEDKTKNLLVMVAPAASAPPPAILFMTKEPITQQSFESATVAVDFIKHVNPNSKTWNQKYWVNYNGVFGHEFKYEFHDENDVNVSASVLITSSANEVKTALEAFSWIGEGNVEVYSPGGLSGRLIIEFVGELAGMEVPKLYRRRIIDTSIPDIPLSTTASGAIYVPEIISYELEPTDMKPSAGENTVTLTPATSNLSGSYFTVGARNLFSHDYETGKRRPWRTEFYDSSYASAGGYSGGPFGYWGAARAYNDSTLYWDGSKIVSGVYYLLQSVYALAYTDDDVLNGPYDRDESGTVVGEATGKYNAKGYDANLLDKNGYDPAGYDVNGLDENGSTWGYFGAWGHFHHGAVSHDTPHKNDHGIDRRFPQWQEYSAGSIGVAVWVDGTGYVVSNIEDRDFYIDTDLIGHRDRTTTY
ncbi:hypothetical protein Pan241w_11140 [Gimesia alba]|uniref:Uncharacterized protein n=1 Tax=Gimesia alba TaxID=2527973 RepID=A0A517RAZ4_9PLAN|nr:hypothetical protein [Gimesia alba]QDT41055.1 hypothetical protein Pan241w_11140 [Gimesia alba]